MLNLNLVLNLLCPGTPCDNITVLVMDLTNKYVTNGDLRVFEDEATITCNPGWEYPDASKDFVVQCNASGLWNDSAPTCQSMSL